MHTQFHHFLRQKTCDSRQILLHCTCKNRSHSSGIHHCTLFHTIERSHLHALGNAVLSYSKYIPERYQSDNLIYIRRCIHSLDTPDTRRIRSSRPSRDNCDRLARRFGEYRLHTLEILRRGIRAGTWFGRSHPGTPRRPLRGSPSRSLRRSRKRCPRGRSDSSRRSGRGSPDRAPADRGRPHAQCIRTLHCRASPGRTRGCRRTENRKRRAGRPAARGIEGPERHPIVIWELSRRVGTYPQCSASRPGRRIEARRPDSSVQGSVLA